MDRYKVNRIVGYIAHRGDFWCDTHDVEEDFNAILAGFGVDEPLTPEEREAVRGEITRLAEAVQTREVARLVFDELDKFGVV